MATPTEPALAAFEESRTGRRLYVPSAGAAAVTALLTWEGLRAAGGTRFVFATIGAERAELVGPSILGFVALVFLVERRWPAVSRPLLARGHLQDAGYLVLYAIAVVPLIALIDVGFSATLHLLAPWFVLPSSLRPPRWTVAVAALLAMDAANWLAHWANHRWRALWRFHAVHHSQEELSVLTSFRAHPLVHASFVVAILPPLFLGPGGALPAVVITVYICLSTLPHANVAWRFGPVGYVLVSPAYHRIHHSVEGPIDVNMGTVFTFWDALSRRAVFPQKGAIPAPTGLHLRPLPVEQAEGASGVTRTLVAQLTEPFLATNPIEGPARTPLYRSAT